MEDYLKLTTADGDPIVITGDSSWEIEQATKELEPENINDVWVRLKPIGRKVQMHGETRDEASMERLQRCFAKGKPLLFEGIEMEILNVAVSMIDVTTPGGAAGIVNGVAFGCESEFVPVDE